MNYIKFCVCVDAQYENVHGQLYTEASGFPHAMVKT